MVGIRKLARSSFSREMFVATFLPPNSSRGVLSIRHYGFITSNTFATKCALGLISCNNMFRSQPARTSRQGDPI
jgi:hypothetical protein